MMQGGRSRPRAHNPGDPVQLRALLPASPGPRTRAGAQRRHTVTGARHPAREPKQRLALLSSPADTRQRLIPFAGQRPRMYRGRATAAAPSWPTGRDWLAVAATIAAIIAWSFAAPAIAAFVHGG